MEKRFEKSFDEADMVVLARPTAIEKSPGIWSGTLATFQAVRYRVSRSLKGSGAAPDQSIVVLHPLVAKSATADTEEVHLLPSAFDPAKKYVVFIRVENDKLYCIDANYGIVVANADVIEALEQLAESRARPSGG
jgi:hypothetical protein